MLTALQLPAAEKEALLPQLSAIIDFVGELDQCVLDGQEHQKGTETYIPQTLPNEGERRTQLLANIDHDIVNSMPQLKTGLVK